VSVVATVVILLQEVVVWVVIVLAIPWHKSFNFLANAAVLLGLSFERRIGGWKLEARMRSTPSSMCMITDVDQNHHASHNPKQNGWLVGAMLDLSSTLAKAAVTRYVFVQLPSVSLLHENFATGA
jgi:hypothetical protein